MTDHEPHRLEGSNSRVTLDLRAGTLTFSHHGSVSTEQQKALSPLVLPLGAVASVECTPGHSTNWFWVVPRGQKPWSKGVWCDPHGVVCGVDPTAFTERVRAAVASAAPVDAEPLAEVPSPGWRGRFAKGLGRAVVDGFFNTR